MSLMCSFVHTVGGSYGLRRTKRRELSVRSVAAYDDGRTLTRAASYEIPLPELLALAPKVRSLPAFDLIWSCLPVTYSRTVRVHHRVGVMDPHPLRTAVYALRDELAPSELPLLHLYYFSSSKILVTVTEITPFPCSLRQPACETSVAL